MSCICQCGIKQVMFMFDPVINTSYMNMIWHSMFCQVNVESKGSVQLDIKAGPLSLTSSRESKPTYDKCPILNLVWNWAMKLSLVRRKEGLSRESPVTRDWYMGILIPSSFQFCIYIFCVQKRYINLEMVDGRENKKGTRSPTSEIKLKTFEL